MNKAAVLEPGRAVRPVDWTARARLGRNLSLVLVLLSAGAAVVTYATLSGSLPFGQDPRAVLVLLNLDLVLFLALGAIVARRLVAIWIARRQGSVGARLHTRLVVWFSLIALVPAIVVSVFSALFFSFGVQTWFSDRVRTALEESTLVAEAYLREHQQVIRGDLLAMARDVSRAPPHLWSEPERFSRFVAAQGMVRNLSEAHVFDGRGRVLARWTLSFVLDHDPIPIRALQKAGNGEPVVLAAASEDRMRAIIKLDGAIDAFLYIGRFVEPRVLDHIARTREAVAQYQSLEGQRRTFEITFAMMFVLVALLLLLAAVWAGLTFATRLASPISALASAAERVRGGDLGARVDEPGDDDEIASLTRAFNRMTEQLGAQRDDLLDANRQIDNRRHFIETVLSGVSAGVIGLDAAGRINVANRSASDLLSLDLDSWIGRRLAHAVPEMSAFLEEARRQPNRQGEMVVILERDGADRSLFARIVADIEDEAVHGFVVTFDDITELQSAQRKAAWSDVARRVAHEIKNPLTPIQLSAERLHRKFRHEITSDPKTFEDYTGTIIRHVGDIGRMVDAFSDFARMPDAVIAANDLVDACRVALTLQRAAHPSVVFVSRFPDQPVIVPCDAGLVGRALTNLLKNAVEAIEARAAGDESPEPGRIILSVTQDAATAGISVQDNGHGLPGGERERLTEPYVTTREKGTGLGLAIVRRIMEDHGGSVSIDSIDEGSGGGACVWLIFPKDGITESTGEGGVRIVSEMAGDAD